MIRSNLHLHLKLQKLEIVNNFIQHRCFVSLHCKEIGNVQLEQSVSSENRNQHQETTKLQMLRATASGYKLISYCSTMSKPLTGDEQAISKVPYWSLAQALARLSCALQCAPCEAAIKSQLIKKLGAVRLSLKHGHKYCTNSFRAQS